MDGGSIALNNKMNYSKIQNTLIYLFSFSLVFESWDIITLEGISIPKIIAYILVFFSLLKPKKILSLFYLKKYLIPLFLFAFLLIFSFVLNTNNSLVGLMNLASILLNVIFFYLLANILSEKPEIAYRAFIALNLGIFIATLLYFFGIGVVFNYDRLTIFGENANRLGIFAVFSLLFIISVIFENPKDLGRIRYLLFIGLLPLLNMIAQTGSRVSFIGLMISVAIFFAFLKARNKQTRILIILIGVVGIYLVYQYIMTFEVIQSRMLMFYEEGDLSGRDRIWGGIIPMIKKRPLFGIGINGYLEASLTEIGRRVSPHNVFLELLVYSGIFGFIAFILFTYRVFIASLRIYRIMGFLLPLVLAIFIVFVFVSGQGLNVKVFWMVFVFIVATWEGNSISWNEREVLKR